MQGLKHNMYKNMCERALRTAGNLDGDNDAEPIYANHVTNMIMAYETYGTPDVRPSSAHARLGRMRLLPVNGAISLSPTEEALN